MPSNPFRTQIEKNNPNIIYASVGNNGVYRSTDGGLNFSARNNGLTDALRVCATGIWPCGGNIRHITMSPADSNRLLVPFQNLFGNFVYYTTDGGANWTQTSSMDEKNADGWVAGSTFGYDFGSGVDDASNPIVFHPTNRDIALVAGWGNQVKRTTDGGKSGGILIQVIQVQTGTMAAVLLTGIQPILTEQPFFMVILAL